ncbi:MAG: amidohydrolase family protein [Candidatus Doudnabacteria bacterium]|nr:amidohydrolase family protein [Candidatus Doudnabacteria bacterium]
MGDKYDFSTWELNHAHPFAISTIIDYPWPDTTLGRLYTRILRNRGAGKLVHDDTVRLVNLKKMADAGITIAAGTDAGNIGTQHATSFFDELTMMKLSGMDNWQLLQAATINGAKAVGQEQQWGSIAKNKMGNMILLNANPLDSLANWKKIDWVINKGKPFRPDSIVVEPYAEEVEIYNTNGKLLSKGKEQMRKDYIFITRMPGLYCKLVNRIVQGNTVIDHEEIWFSNKPENLQYGVAIYVVEKGKISRVYFAE